VYGFQPYFYLRLPSKAAKGDFKKKFAEALGRRRRGIEVRLDELEVLDAVLGRKGHDLVESHVAARPSLEAKLRRSLRGGRVPRERERNCQQGEEAECFHGIVAG
jgi:hypothetical protein